VTLEFHEPSEENQRVMTADFAPLLAYLDKRFDSIERDMAELKDAFSSLQGSVDAYAKRADAYFQEMVVLTHTVQRHDRWLQQIAKQLGITLEY
jgi:hypothetical protein